MTDTLAGGEGRDNIGGGDEEAARREALDDYCQTLDRVYRRIGESVEELTRVRDFQPAAREMRGSEEAVAADRGELYLDCVRLEVALAESTKWARKLSQRATAAAQGDRPAPPE